MINVDERIEQFRKMANDDPDNDMAHFSLGNAYLQADRPAEAAASFERCLQLNPDMSKAWQLAGQALLRAGDEAKAVEVLEKGLEIAASRGDLMPRDEMAELLRSVGREPPALHETATADEPNRAAGGFVCSRSGRPGSKLPEPPMRGPLGEWIQEHISAETWHEWIGQGTKVINELRLDFSSEEDQRTYDQYMCEFLGISPELYEQLA